MCAAKSLCEVQLSLYMTTLLQRFTLKFPENQRNPSLQPEPNNVFRQPPPFNIIAVPR